MLLIKKIPKSAEILQAIELAEKFGVDVNNIINNAVTEKAFYILINNIRNDNKEWGYCARNGCNFRTSEKVSEALCPFLLQREKRVEGFQCSVGLYATNNQPKDGHMICDDTMKKMKKIRIDFIDMMRDKCFKVLRSLQSCN